MTGKGSPALLDDNAGGAPGMKTPLAPALSVKVTERKTLSTWA